MQKVNRHPETGKVFFLVRGNQVLDTFPTRSKVEAAKMRGESIYSEQSFKALVYRYLGLQKLWRSQIDQKRTKLRELIQDLAQADTADVDGYWKVTEATIQILHREIDHLETRIQSVKLDNLLLYLS